MSMKELNAYEFWNRIDCSKGPMSLKELAEQANVKYTSIKDQRSKNRLPNLIDAYALASILNTTIDYLLTGENTSTLSEEAQAVERDEKLRLLVNTLMHDPHLLEVVSTVNQSARHVDVKNTNKGA